MSQEKMLISRKDAAQRIGISPTFLTRILKKISYGSEITKRIPAADLPEIVSRIKNYRESTSD